MDHGFINPISDKYAKLISANFDVKKWDIGSGYPGISSFNEYMTWAVYDLFIQENFPAYSDSIALQWQYQNASRGFIAQNLFSKKLLELFLSKKAPKKIEEIYEPLLSWCKQVEHKLTQPKLMQVDNKKFVEVDKSSIQLQFSHQMATQPFGVQLLEFKNGQPVGNEIFIEIKDAKWSGDQTKVNFGINLPYQELAVILNWWGIDKPLLSKDGMTLEPKSYTLLKVRGD